MSLLVCCGAGCEKSEKIVDLTKQETPAAAQTNAAEAPAESTNLVAVIHTSEGDMVAEFWPEVAPKTVENFKKLAKEGFYSGTAFHRIIKGFMIQGGDPLTKDPNNAPMYGTGGPGYTVPAEFSDRKHVKGVLSMARGPDPNSAGSQFFVCLAPAQSLDNSYTAFGKLIKGEDVLEKIGDTPVAPNPRMPGEVSVPLKRIEIKNIEIVPANSVQ